VEPKACTYDGVIREVAAAGAWVPIVPPGHVPSVYANARTGTANAAMGAILQAMSPDLMARLQSAVESGDPSRRAALEEEIMQAMGGEARANELAAKLGAALKDEAPAYAAEMEARLKGRVAASTRKELLSSALTGAKKARRPRSR